MRRCLTIACGDYDRTHPLIDGTIKPEGLELNWLTLPHNEIWRRMLNDYDFDASEIALASYIIGKTMGKRLIAIPVFPARAFRHSYIFTNVESGIREPWDLMGKRVGVSEFQQTATVWVRGILQHEYGVALENIDWLTWARRSRMEIEMPKRYSIRPVDSDKPPDKLLIDGDLDALVSPNVFASFDGHPKVRRLFENYEEVEQMFFKKTSIFPIMHTVVMREELWHECPWIAISLYKAFQEAKAIAYRNLNDPSAYKISLAWFREPVKEQKASLGADPWVYGLRANHHVLETLMTYLTEQGLIERKPSIEELFATNSVNLE